MANEPTLDTVFKRVDTLRVDMPVPARAAAPVPTRPVESPSVRSAEEGPPAMPAGPNPFTMPRDASAPAPAPPAPAPIVEARQEDVPVDTKAERYPFREIGSLPVVPTAEDFVDWLIGCVMRESDARCQRPTPGPANALPMLAAFLEEASEVVRERARERLRRVEEETEQLQLLLGGGKPARKKAPPAVPPAAGASGASGASDPEPQGGAAERAQDRQREEDRVLEYLRLGQLDRVTARRIAESTGYTYSQAGYILQRLREKGLVTVSGRGIGSLWSLVPEQPQAQGTPS